MPCNIIRKTHLASTRTTRNVQDACTALFTLLHANIRVVIIKNTAAAARARVREEDHWTVVRSLSSKDACRTLALDGHWSMPESLE